MSGITEIEHGHYLIKAGKLSGAWVARAFPRPPAKTKGLVAEASGKTLEDAVEALKSKMADATDDRVGARRLDEDTGFHVPLEGEYLEALQQTRLSAPQLAMLRAHALAGDEGLTATELARAAGYKTYETANATYGRAGKAIGAYLGIEPPALGHDEGATHTGLLASGAESRSAQGHFVWVMYPELRSAVRAMG